MTPKTLVMKIMMSLKAILSLSKSLGGKKSRIFHYVARVDVFEGDEFEGVFLRRVLRVNDRPTFILDAEDEALWFKSDIVKKLPIPTIVGTSRRAQFQFHCNLNRWNLK